MSVLTDIHSSEFDLITFNLNIETCDSIRDRWNQFVISHSKGSVFHTLEMVACYQQVDRNSPLAIAATNDRGEIVAMLVAVRVSSLPRPLDSLGSRAIGYCEPICNEDAQGYAGLKLLIDTYDLKMKSNSLFSEIRPLMPVGKDRNVLESFGHHWLNYLNYIVRTDCSVDRAWERLSKSCRSQTKRSCKRGVEVEITNSHTGIDTMYALIAESYSRSRVPLVDVRLFHEALDRLQAGTVQVRIARYHDHVVAGGIGLVFKGRFYAWYGGSKRMNGVYPFNCLTWDEIQWCCENDVSDYDFGGAGWPDEEYGPRDFKARFGGQLTQLGRYRKTYSPWKLALAEKGYSAVRRFLAPSSEGSS